MMCMETNATRCYQITAPWGESFRVEADLTRAAAPISIVSDDGESTTQYQTADTQHTEAGLVRCAIEAMGIDWYASPEDDRDSEVILAEVVEAATIKEVV